MEKNTDIKKLLGSRIKKLREKKKLTQEQLSEIIGVGQRNLSKIECGNNFVTAETLSKIINALEVKPAELFMFENKKDKEVLKGELIGAIKNESVDINLLYSLYLAIK